MAVSIIDRASIPNLSIGRISIGAEVIVFALVSFAFVYLQLFLLPATPILYEEDHLYIMHDAWRMYQGEMIYRDFFQIMYPGTQLLYLAFFYVFGLKYWIAGVIILLQALVSTALVLRISQKLIADRLFALLPPSLYLFFGFRWFGIDGNHRVFSPIFALLAVYVLLGGRGLQRVAIAGVLCGIASFFTQQRGLLAIGAIGIFLIIQSFVRRDSLVEVVRRCLVAGAAFAATITILILPFVVATGPAKFFDYTLFFISSYVKEPTGNYNAYILGLEAVLSMGTLITASALFYYALIPFVYLASLGVLIVKRAEIDERERDVVLLVSLLGLAFAAGTFAPNPARLFQIAAPAVIVFGWLVYRFKRFTWAPVGLAIVVLPIFGIVSAIRTQTQHPAFILDAPTGNIAILSSAQYDKYHWLNANAESSDAVFEVYNCAVNFPLLLQNPTQETQLFNSGYSPLWQVERAIKSLEERNARFIVWDGNWTEQMRDIGENQKLKPLYRYLVEKYELRHALTPYSGRKPEIWERRN